MTTPLTFALPAAGPTVRMPAVGFGTWQIPNDQAAAAVSEALRVGYRNIDTARVYGNQRGVGEGIRRSGIPREDIFITTKLGPSDQGEEAAERAVMESLQELGVDYIDLYLVHWPGSSDVGKTDPGVVERRHGTWKALQKLHKEGKVRAIGVSNFMQRHLVELLKWPELEVKPAVNQCECHPYLPQNGLRDFCRAQGILFEAYSSLGRGKELLQDARVTKIGEAHAKTPAQVLLRWAVQHGMPVIPKSVTPERIRSNFEVSDFELSDAEMAEIDGMESGERYCWNPETIEH